MSEDNYLSKYWRHHCLEAQAKLEAVTAERDALSAQLAALKKRVADAERVDHYFPTRTPGPQRMTFALVRLEAGE